MRHLSLFRGFAPVFICLSVIGSSALAAEIDELERVRAGGICKPDMATYNWVSYKEHCGANYTQNLDLTSAIRCQSETDSINNKISQYNAFVTKCRSFYRHGRQAEKQNKQTSRLDPAGETPRTSASGSTQDFQARLEAARQRAKSAEIEKRRMIDQTTISAGEARHSWNARLAENARRREAERRRLIEEGDYAPYRRAYERSEMGADISEEEAQEIVNGVIGILGGAVSGLAAPSAPQSYSGPRQTYTYPSRPASSSPRPSSGGSQTGCDWGTGACSAR